MIWNTQAYSIYWNMASEASQSIGKHRVDLDIRLEESGSHSSNTSDQCFNGPLNPSQVAFDDKVLLGAFFVRITQE